MRRLWLVALLVTAGGWDALRAPDPDVDKGNQAFKAGRFDEALGHYRSAETRGVDPRLHFDMGAAIYKLGEKAGDDAAKAKLFQEAEEQFRRAADSDDMRLKSLAYFNLGNAMYQRQQWEDAVSAYKRALRANPNNEPARNNLEMALRQREKQDKQEQQQGQKGQQGQKHDQKQDQQGGQGQGQKDKQEHQDGQGKQDQQQGQPGQQHEDQQPRSGQPQGAEPPDQQQQQSSGDQKAEDQKQAEREERARRQQHERERQQQQQQAQPPDDASAGTDSPTDQERKLDELERRSRELRKRLLRQGGKNRDPLHLPSRRDW